MREGNRFLLTFNAEHICLQMIYCAAHHGGDFCNTEWGVFGSKYRILVLKVQSGHWVKPFSKFTRTRSRNKRALSLHLPLHVSVPQASCSHLASQTTLDLCLLDDILQEGQIARVCTHRSDQWGVVGVSNELQPLDWRTGYRPAASGAARVWLIGFELNEAAHTQPTVTHICIGDTLQGDVCVSHLQNQERANCGV